MSFIDTGEDVIAIPEGVSRIGRGITADLRFEDPSVANRHALLIREAGVVRVLDDRGPGVLVNGERITAKVLHDGDVITIGRHELRFAATRPVAA